MSARARLDIVTALALELQVTHGMELQFALRLASKVAPTVQRLMDEEFDRGYREAFKVAFGEKVGQ